MSKWTLGKPGPGASAFRIIMGERDGVFLAGRVKAASGVQTTGTITAPGVTEDDCVTITAANSGAASVSGLYATCSANTIDLTFDSKNFAGTEEFNIQVVSLSKDVKRGIWFYDSAKSKWTLGKPGPGVS